jgi:DNA-binding response OmpR family regulator
VKRNVLLITNCEKNLTSRGANGKITADGKENTFEILSFALHDIDLAIVDIGANMQSLAIIETLSHREPAPPVIALVDGDDKKAMSKVHQYGAAACLRKPFKADELARLIEVVCASHDDSASCDKWGHVCAGAHGNGSAT